LANMAVGGDRKSDQETNLSFDKSNKPSVRKVDRTNSSEVKSNKPSVRKEQKVEFGQFQI